MDTFSFNYEQILTATFTLFAVIDVLGSLPVFIGFEEKNGKIESGKATLASGALMVLFLIVGQQFLKIMGVDIKSFALAGSIVMFILALEMILGLEFFKAEPGAKGTIVPIAFPIIAGSGTLTTIMSLKSSLNDFNIIAAILINMVIIFLALKSLALIPKFLGRSGQIAVRKFFGVILLAISVKIFRTNLGF
jgi:multiple antibiotic resistance protein